MKTKTLNMLELTYNNIISLQYKVEEHGVLTNDRSTVDSRQDLSGMSEIVQDIAKAFPFTEFENPDGACCHADLIRVLASNRSKVTYNISEYIYKDDTEVVHRSQRHSVTVDCLEDITQHPEKVQKFASIVFTDEVKAAYIASLPLVEVENEDTRQKTVDLPVMVDNPEYGALIPNPEFGQLIENPDFDPEDETSQEFIKNTSVPKEIKNLSAPKEIQDTETVDEAYEAYEELDGAVLRQIPAGVRQVEKPMTETVGVVDEDENPVTEIYKTGKFTTFIEYKGKHYPKDWDGSL